MTVYFVGAGPGDPELLTLKAARIIGQCPVCLFAGSLVPLEVVDCAPNDARVLDTMLLVRVALVSVVIASVAIVKV